MRLTKPSGSEGDLGRAVLSAEVEYRDITSEGLLRQSSFKGLTRMNKGAGPSMLFAGRGFLPFPARRTILRSSCHEPDGTVSGHKKAHHKRLPAIRIWAHTLSAVASTFLAMTMLRFGSSGAMERQSTKHTLSFSERCLQEAARLANLQPSRLLALEY
jgi:hypothetical protein